MRAKVEEQLDNLNDATIRIDEELGGLTKCTPSLLTFQR